MPKRSCSSNIAVVDKANVPPAWSAEQKRLAALRIDQDLIDWSVADDGKILDLKLVAGMDLSRFPDDTYAVATVVVLSFPELEVMYERSVLVRSSVPYVPGFLAFREVPPLAALLAELPVDMIPQVVFVDGNGAFHPRQCGAATHLGVATGLPTIGVAKKVQAVGDVNIDVARLLSRELQSGGSWAPLIGATPTARWRVAHENAVSEAFAALLRPTSGRAPPLVVSPGHRVSLQTAATLTAAVCRHSIAEPIRQADLRSRKAVRSWLAGTKLPSVRLRDPGTKCRSGQASCMPVVNRMLKQRDSELCADGELLSAGECNGVGERRQSWQSEEHPADGIAGYSYSLFSWLFKDTLLGCCFRRVQVGTDPTGEPLLEEPEESRKADLSGVALETQTACSTAAAARSSADVMRTASSSVGGFNSRNTQAKQSRGQLKWQPKETQQAVRSTATIASNCEEIDTVDAALSSLQGRWIDASKSDVRYQIEGAKCTVLAQKGPKTFSLEIDKSSQCIWWGTGKRYYADVNQSSDQILWRCTRDHRPCWTWLRAVRHE